MNKRFLLLAVLIALLISPVVGFAEKPPEAGPPIEPGPPDDSGPPDDPGPPNDDPGNKDEYAATPNLSFPLIATDVIQMFYQQECVDADGDGTFDSSECILDYDLDDDGVNEMTVPTPIEVAVIIADEYIGDYENNDDAEHCEYTVEDGCAVDINNDGVIDDDDLTCVPMVGEEGEEGWLEAMQPWYAQPVFTLDPDPNLIWDATNIDTSEIGGAHSWQADWYWTGDVDGDPETADPVADDFAIEIDFVDWGNPLENINPIVGQRFPVEVALFEKVETPMTAYKMACLENPGSKDEVFGTSTLDGDVFTYESVFATVLTNKFTAEVYDPNGGITTINLGPGIGPSGKMNFASGGGGWTPKMPGWHRIWLHTNDPLISLSGAIVNNDEHYIMTTGCMAQTLNPNKLELTGIIGNSTYIDVLVVSPSGNQ